MNLSAFDKKDVLLTEDEREQYHIVKKKMLGNIKFIGKDDCLQRVSLKEIQNVLLVERNFFFHI